MRPLKKIRFDKEKFVSELPSRRMQLVATLLMEHRSFPVKEIMEIVHEYAVKNTLKHAIWWYGVKVLKDLAAMDFLKITEKDTVDFNSNFWPRNQPKPHGK